MEPMPSTRRSLIWLSMCSPDGSPTRWRKLAYSIYTVICLGALIACLAGDVAYCIKFVRVDLGRSMFSFVFIVGEFGVIYMGFVGIYFMRHEVHAIFETLSTIYNASKNEDSFRFLAHANNTSEWMWKIYFKFVILNINIMNQFVVPVISILYNWLIEDNLDVVNFFHPLPLVLPWNQTTYWGYIAELCLLIPLSYGYTILSGTFLIFFISICLHHRAFYEMFKHSLDRAKKCDAKLLCNSIRFHISVKDWFLDTAYVYSTFIMVQLICSEIVMAVSLFYLDFQFRDGGFDVTSAFTAISLGITNLLAYCYFGKSATESYLKMSDCVWNMAWYELPNDLQKIYVMMIANIQKPIYYHGFNVIDLNLETFTKLSKSAISFYMAVKRLHQ